MKKIVLSLIIGASLISCNEEPEKSTEMKSDNPLLVKEFSTPYEVPPFDLLQSVHFEEAMIIGMEEQKRKIQIIIDNEDEPTWDNTLLAMETSGETYARASRIFYNLNSSHTNDEIQEIARKMSAKSAAHSDFIYMNMDLFNRVAKIWETNKEDTNLSPQQHKVLEKTYKRFVRSGAKLNKEDQEELASINAQIAELTTQFGQNILSDTNAFELLIEDETRLEGIPNSLLESAFKKAKEKDEEGKWLFTIQNSNVMPILEYAEDRELRREIYEAYKRRGNNNNEFNNTEIALKLANLRLEKANLLGYDTYADYALETTMAKDRSTVEEFLLKLWKPALIVAEREIEDIAILLAEDGIKDQVQPWDYKYYLEKIKKDKFDINNQEVAEYFSLDQVREGIFTVTDQLFGLQFKELEDVPVYHEDVTVWEVSEKDGTHVGVLYMDMHPRSSKRSGAWMTSFRPQTMKDGERYAPVISINCNFTDATSTKPSLLTFDEVTTFFHEFGHALHGLLSNVEYESLAGTNVSRDFVELPSQVMENWATDPEVLKMYAFHYDTGEVIPDELINKLEELGTFGQGFATTEYLASSLLDMKYHTIEEPLDANVVEFEVETLANLGMPSSITARHSSTHFAHVFAGGYSAGYYSYIWSGVLDTDAFDQFKQTELFNQEKARSFRENILETGGTEEPMELYKRFRGSEPSIEPLLKKRGLDIDSYDDDLKG
ncbi:MAG: M3 family metallopeptidase [Flavobacteriaceae bacterium]|nr:M3 family metallopeptidase [Flavobacteriaceae bacterium]